MSMLNYTTSIAASRSVAEISTLLAKGRCAAIMTEFDDFGNPKAISFRVSTADGLMSFRLPANAAKVLECLKKDPKVPARDRTLQHAQNVSWRILKDWLAAQMSLIESSMVTLPQVFLPYVQNAQGETLYEALQKTNFSGLALPPAASQS